MNLVEVELSDKELDLLLDSEVLPLKRQICEKIEQILLHLKERLSEEILKNEEQLPDFLWKQGGRISRGDNYRSYAYRVLDCPAYFDRRDWFTFRTVVMWGHHSGFHLILHGRFKEVYQDSVVNMLRENSEDLFLTVSDSPWEWIPNTEDHIKLDGTDIGKLEQVVGKQPFIKLSYYIPLERYAEIPDIGVAQWKRWQNKLFQKNIYDE